MAKDEIQLGEVATLACLLFHLVGPRPGDDPT